MSGSTGNRASDAPQQLNRRDRIMNLTTARNMLPLVSRIVADILDLQYDYEMLEPEASRLDRQRKDLSWPERQRRYVIHDEMQQLEQKMQDTIMELHELGVALIDPDIGRIGFPTLVNNRPAFFAWWPGEEEVSQWHFATDLRCRSIPPSWIELDQVSMK